MKFLKKYPLPIAGLILSIFALGNLIRNYGEAPRNLLGIVGGILYLLYLLKLMVLRKQLAEPLKNPVIASVIPTITMATMLIPTYIKPYAPTLATPIWYIGVLGHLFYYLWFALRFGKDFSIKKVFPSWYIVGVGVAVASVTAPAVEQITLGQISFWIALGSYVCLLPVVLYRVWKVREIPEPAKPTLIILAAPASLLLAGYLSNFEKKNGTFVLALALLSYFFYFVALLYLPKLLATKFSPAFSAFTFPLVISGIASKMFLMYLQKAESLALIIKIQEGIAVAIVLFVLIKYLVFLFQPQENNA